MEYGYYDNKIFGWSKQVLVDFTKYVILRIEQNIWFNQENIQCTQQKFCSLNQILLWKQSNNFVEQKKKILSVTIFIIVDLLFQLLSALLFK